MINEFENKHLLCWFVQMQEHPRKKLILSAFMHLMKIVFVEKSIAARSVVPWEIPATVHPHANYQFLSGKIGF